jgi:transposase InsO family protein
MQTNTAKRVPQYKFIKSVMASPTRPEYYGRIEKRGADYIFVSDGERKHVIWADEADDFIKNFYSDINNPAALRGSLAVYKAIAAEHVGVSRRDVERVLVNMETTQLFRAAPTVPVIRPQVARAPNQQWSADTAYVEHEGERLFTVLVAVDIMSKFMWARMVRIPATHQRFSGKTVAAAMEDILQSEPGRPSTMKTDNGPEFVSRDFNAVLARFNIKHLYAMPHNPRSNAFAEICVKSLKVLIGKYLNSVNGIYIDNKTLQSIVDSYNRTYHSTIKAAPESVHFGDKAAVSAAHANIKSRAVRVVAKSANVYPPLEVGDYVRVHNRVESAWRRYTKLKARVYMEQWSVDIFKVIFITRPKPGLSSHYYLSIGGQKITLPFVRADLQKVDRGALVPNLAPGHYQVERVLDKKIVNGKAKYLVMWAGYPRSQATWESAQKGYADLIADYESRQKQ